jgi:hypothetical protein
VFPSEPPVAFVGRQNGAEPARARRFWARRSEPLPSEHRSGMPIKWRWAAEREHDRRDPVGGLRAMSRIACELATPARLREERGSQRGKKPLVSFPFGSVFPFPPPGISTASARYRNGGGNGHSTLHRRSSRILAAFMRRAHSVSLIASACRSNSAKLKPGFRYCPARSSDCSFFNGV